MIEEVLNEIRDAELKAEQIKLAGEEEAKKIIAEGEKEALDIRNETEKNIKVMRTNGLYQAELTAGGNYDKTMADGKAESEKLKKDLSEKVDELSDEVFGRILDGSC